MKFRLLTGAAVCFSFLMVNASLCPAQGRPPQRFHRARIGTPAGLAPNPGAVPEQSTGYNFTFINFPGSDLGTCCLALNKGATASQQLIAGSYGATAAAVGSSIKGFLLTSSSEDGVSTETFSPANYPGATQSFTSEVNDLGQVVGAYEDSKGVWHGYELSDGKYTAINVSFSGAVDTYMAAINDAGDMVGSWDDGNPANISGFELIGGVYTAIQFPGATTTQPQDINDSGEIAGFYSLNGDYVVQYGFTLSGGSYTPSRYPAPYQRVSPRLTIQANWPEFTARQVAAQHVKRTSRAQWGS
jgi:hypothetical protein